MREGKGAVSSPCHLVGFTPTEAPLHQLVAFPLLMQPKSHGFSRVVVNIAVANVLQPNVAAELAFVVPNVVNFDGSQEVVVAVKQLFTAVG
jgi:hypothetical protein